MDLGVAVILAFAALAVAGVVAGVAVWSIRRRRRQRRLERGFERARRVRQSGTGEQGRPYSVYTENTWQD